MEYQANDAPPSVRSRRSRRADHPGVCHEDQRHVLGAEVAAEAASLLCPLGQLSEAQEGPVADFLELSRRGEGHCQNVGEAEVAGLHLAESLDVPAESIPRVVIG